MSNKIHTTRLMPTLFQTTGDPKHILGGKNYHSAPCTTMKTLNVIVVVCKRLSTLWIRQLSRWIANVRLRLQRHGHNRLLPRLPLRMMNHNTFPANFWKIVAEWIAREHANQLQKAVQQGIGKALSDIILTDYTEAEENWRSLSTEFLKRFSLTWLENEH